MNPIPTWLKSAAWLAVAVWAAAICWLSSRTGPEIEELNVFDLWDKAAHFSAFFTGAIALTIALRWSTAWPWLRLALFAAVVISLFGASDEYHQLFTPNRSGADVFDWLADTLGGIAGTCATALLYARFTRPPRPAPARA